MAKIKIPSHFPQEILQTSENKSERSEDSPRERRAQGRVRQCLQEFLLQFHDGRSPLLVGVSGGSDSMALFKALADLQTGKAWDLHVAHVDHAWRSESTEEALQVREWTRPFSFHLKRLAPEQKGNPEAVAREARLRFFEEILKKEGCQAVLLAHQLEDQAETVFMRLCGGASLWNCGGMRECSALGGLPIWRPFLSIPKKTLQTYLGDQSFITDPSNEDLHFQRVKIRKKVLPLLREHLWKDPSTSLAHLGQQFEDCQTLLRELARPLLTEACKDEKGYYWNLEGLRGRPKIIQDYVLQEILSMNECLLSRKFREQVIRWIACGAKKKQVQERNCIVEVDDASLRISISA